MLASFADSFNVNKIEAELNEIEKQQLEKLERFFSPQSEDYLSVRSKLNEIRRFLAEVNDTNESVVKAQRISEAYEVIYTFINEYQKILAPEICAALKSIAIQLRGYEKLFYGLSILLPLNSMNTKEFTANLKSHALGMQLIAEAFEIKFSDLILGNYQYFKGLATANLRLEAKLDIKDWKESEELFFTYKKILHRAASFIVWKLEENSPDIFGSVEQVNSLEISDRARFSYRKIYEQIGKSARSQENQRIIELLRAWREEDKVSDSE